MCFQNTSRLLNVDVLEVENCRKTRVAGCEWKNED